MPRPDRVVIVIQSRVTGGPEIKVFYDEDADPWLNRIGDEDALAELARP